MNDPWDVVRMAVEVGADTGVLSRAEVRAILADADALLAVNLRLIDYAIRRFDLDGDKLIELLEVAALPEHLK